MAECFHSFLDVAKERNGGGLPEFVLGGVVFEAGCGEDGFEGGAVDVEVGAQLVEGCVLVAQLGVDVAEEHHWVGWQIFHNSDVLWRSGSVWLGAACVVILCVQM